MEICIHMRWQTVRKKCRDSDKLGQYSTSYRPKNSPILLRCRKDISKWWCVHSKDDKLIIWKRIQSNHIYVKPNYDWTAEQFTRSGKVHTVHNLIFKSSKSSSVAFACQLWTLCRQHITSSQSRPHSKGAYAESFQPIFDALQLELLQNLYLPSLVLQQQENDIRLINLGFMLNCNSCKTFVTNCFTPASWKCVSYRMIQLFQALEFHALPWLPENYKITVPCNKKNCYIKHVLNQTQFTVNGPYLWHFVNHFEPVPWENAFQIRCTTHKWRTQRAWKYVCDLKVRWDDHKIHGQLLN